MSNNKSSISWAQLSVVLVILVLTGMFLSLAHVVSLQVRQDVLKNVIELRKEVSELRGQLGIDE